MQCTAVTTATPCREQAIYHFLSHGVWDTCRKHTPIRFRKPENLIANQASRGRTLVSTGTPSRRLDIASGLDRKPWDWSEISPINPSEMNFGGVSKEQFLDGLPIHKSEQLLSRGGRNVLEEFRAKMPQYFILEHKGSKYLVDTQGYDYARYIGRL